MCPPNSLLYLLFQLLKFVFSQTSPNFIIFPELAPKMSFPDFVFLVFPSITFMPFSMPFFFNHKYNFFFLIKFTQRLLSQFFKVIFLFFPKLLFPPNSLMYLLFCTSNSSFSQSSAIHHFLQNFSKMSSLITFVYHVFPS